MIIKPINDNIVVKVDKEQNSITKSGIVLVSKEQNTIDQGTVIATGRGRLLQNGEIIPISVKENDIIIFNKYAGTKIKVGDEEYLILRENDILAKF